MIRRADQLSALGSPVRWAVTECLSVHGPSSVRELAARLGRLAESLYYHVRLLVKVGLVVVDHERKAARRSEAVYRLVAPRLMVDPKRRSAEFLSALAGTCATLLRQTEREHRAAVGRGGLALAGSGRNIMVRRGTVRLNRAGLAALNRALDGVLGVLEKHRDTRAGDPYAVTLVLTPLSASAE